MIFMVLYLFCVIAALGLGALAGWTDYKGMTIPNYIVAVILAAFFGAFAAAHFGGVGIFAPLLKQLAGGFAVFAVTFVLFSLKKFGGGDSKLLTAYSFWFGMAGLPVFLFYTMLLGAVLGIIALVLKKKKPVAAPAEGSWVARVQGGESVVPYGIPIALGAFAAFIYGGFLAPETLSLFLMPN